MNFSGKSIHLAKTVKICEKLQVENEVLYFRLKSTSTPVYQRINYYQLQYIIYQS